VILVIGALTISLVASAVLITEADASLRDKALERANNNLDNVVLNTVLTVPHI
jgi:hypothetical protein